MFPHDVITFKYARNKIVSLKDRLRFGQIIQSGKLTIFSCSRITDKRCCLPFCAAMLRLYGVICWSEALWTTSLGVIIPLMFISHMFHNFALIEPKWHVPISSLCTIKQSSHFYVYKLQSLPLLMRNEFGFIYEQIILHLSSSLYIIASFVVSGLRIGSVRVS